jgi:hypothetical protein
MLKAFKFPEECIIFLIQILTYEQLLPKQPQSGWLKVFAFMRPDYFNLQQSSIFRKSASPLSV